MSLDPSKDTADKDSPAGIILSYRVHISEQAFKLPFNEFKDWLGRVMAEMTRQNEEAAIEQYVIRETDKDFPTEFTASM